MPGWQRTYVAGCAFAAAFVLAYVGVDFAWVPRLFYDAIHEDWSLVRRSGPVPMGYVGLWLWALVAGVVAAAAVFVGARWKKTPLQPVTLHLIAGWTLSVAVIAVAYFTWHNKPF